MDDVIYVPEHEMNTRFSGGYMSNTYPMGFLSKESCREWIKALGYTVYDDEKGIYKLPNYMQKKGEDDFYTIMEIKLFE